MNMKKMLAMLLTLALTLTCFAALAEEQPKEQLGSINMNGAFKLQCTVAEGYQMYVQSKDDEGLLAMISSEDKAKPIMFFAIEFDEQYAEIKRLNDLSEEELQELASTFTTENETVSVSYTETSHGTKLMLVRDASDIVTYASFLTIYEGYMIEFDMVPGYDMTMAGEGLSESQIQMCVDFLSDLDFIPEEA